MLDRVRCVRGLSLALSMQPALDGIRVLELAGLLPGPFCGLCLVELGAEVIKVEPPQGDMMRYTPPAPHTFEAVNRGKQSIALNLKQDAGRELFLRLADSADVILEGWRPGVAERLGVDYETLKARNPKLIYCAITGYGQEGTRRDQAGHDLNYNAAAGLLSITGNRAGGPVVPGPPIADLVGGGFQALTAILAALIQRERQGHGCYLDIAMSEGLLGLLVLAQARMAGGAGEPGLENDLLTGIFPNYRIYETADGHLAVGALEPVFWARFLQAAGLESLQNSPVMGPEAPKVHEAVAAHLKTRSNAQWMEVLGPADCCVEPVIGLAEAMDNPDLEARDRFVHREDYRLLRALAGLPMAPVALGPAPDLDGDRERLLGDLGS